MTTKRIHILTGDNAGKTVEIETGGSASDLTELLSTSTATAGTETVMDMKAMQDAIELIKNLPPEPIKKWMLDNGFNPDEGDIVFWPYGDADVFGGYCLPDYVKLSRLIDEPFVARNPAALIKPKW